ncbi:hypothetical protein ACHQM5_001126 [Ranunculus cassubicifolius]
MLQWFEDQKSSVINHPIALPLLLIFLSILFLPWLSGIWVTLKYKLPPSPPRFPVIGHLHYLGTLPHRSLRALSHKYGPLMLLHLGVTPTLVVSSAKMARELMKTHDIIFSDRPNTKAAKEFGGKGVIFAPYGEYWRQMKKICVIDLLSVKKVQSFRYVRDEEIKDMVKNIKELCLLEKNVNLGDLIVGVTNNIISRAALGKRLEGKERIVLIKETNDLFEAFNFEDLFPGCGWIDVFTGITRKLKKTSRALHSLLDKVINEHMASLKTNAQSDRKDMVDLLLEAENDLSLGVEFTRDGHRAVILDMFGAGTETTSTTLEWVMVELLTHPNVMNKLQDEVRRVVGTKSMIDEDDITQMDYLKCVIKESLRLHPPIALSVPRVSATSTDIEGYHIPAKTRVLINLWAICRDPKTWARPDEFIPERFLNNPVDYRGAHFEFIPFGAGRRACPGIAFGIASVESILANFIYWFDWELAGGANKIDIDTTESFGISLHLKHPLVLVPRSHFS